MRDWAEPELHYLNQLVSERGAFIDCGANIGIYTVRGAGIVGSNGKVISVEPAAVSFQRLKRNIDLNKFAQVALVNKAISDREDTGATLSRRRWPCSLFAGAETRYPI